MEVVKVWHENEYINVLEIESIEIIENTVEFFEIVIYVRNTNGDYHRPVYRANSKKDCCIILEAFLDMINAQNSEKRLYKYIIDLEKVNIADNE